MDPMSDVLAGMHVRSFGYGRLEAQSPWGLRHPKRSTSLGMVLQGTCWLTVDRIAESVELNTGDCYLIVHGDPHTLRDRPNSPAIAIDEAMAVKGGPVFRIAGEGPTSIVVGGWFRFDSVTSRPLTKIIPPLIHISAADARALGLDTTLQSLANETRGPAPGAAVVVNRLAEVLFIQMIRAYASSSLNRAPGWLSALADQQIGAVLHLMHGKIDRSWTVSELARAVGMSRSAFAQRFRIMVGETPMEYLTNWRLLKARRLLRKRDLKLGQVASSVGYDSAASFCHAFKHYLGMTPGQYREQQNRPPLRRGRRGQ